MGDIEKLESEVERLSPQELAKFRAWFLEFDAAAWDKEIAEDSKKGKFESLIAEAKSEFASGVRREM